MLGLLLLMCDSAGGILTERIGSRGYFGVRIKRAVAICRGNLYSRHMPKIDFAILADYVRVEGGIGHLVAGGIDTIYARQVPTGQNIGLMLRIEHTKTECDRPHRIEVIFMDEDGKELVKVNATGVPTWDDSWPPGWKSKSLIGFNFGIPLERYGIYSFRIVVNDSEEKDLPVRVVALPEPQSAGS